MTPSPPLPFRQLILSGLLTSPLIALMMVTPVFIISRLEAWIFWLAFPAAAFFSVFSWTLHILLLRFSPFIRRHSWLCIPLVTAMMIAVSWGIFELIRQPSQFLSVEINLVRVVNAFSMNTIIFIISNLILERDRRTRLDAEHAELKFAHLETQFKLLKEQVNPHFLFNALGTARSLVRRDPSAGEEYILRLSAFLRAAFTQQTDIVSLKDELRLCDDYIALQRMRFHSALEFHTETESSQEEWVLPYFALLTAIENCIKHNRFTPESPLRIAVKQTGKTIRVSNNIQPKEIPDSGSGTGLNNLRERYKLLWNTSILVQKESDTFTVILPVRRA